MEVHKPKFVKGFIAEIFIIVIGISLAVTAERLVEHFQHRKESKGVITRMIAELRRDSVDLEFNLAYHTNASVADSVLTRWSRHEVELPTDSITYFANNSLLFTFFASNTAEIEALKGAGKLYLIENEELLSTILKHYDRYADFKLFTETGIKISDRLNELYKSNARLNANVNFASGAPNYLFDGAALSSNLRGNQRFENALQEKRVIDEFVIQRTRSALKRTIKIMQQLQEEN
jgi:hypothetical protein